MADELKIQIVGTLNTGKSIGEINTAIKGIEKKIKQLNLKVDIDQKVLQTLSNFTKAINKQQDVLKDLNKAFKEEETVIKKADGSTEKLTRTYLKSGEIIEKSKKTIIERTKSIENETKATSKLITELDNLGKKQKEITKRDSSGNITGGAQKYKDGFTDTTYNYDRGGNVTSQRTVENFDQREKAVEKLRQKLIQLNNTGQVTNSSLARMNKVIDGAKTVSELNRIKKALGDVDNSTKAREKTRELEHQLKLYKQQAELSSKNLQRTHGGFIDNSAMQNYLNSVKNLSTSTPNLSRAMQDLNMQFKEISVNSKSAAGAAQQAGMSFKEMISTAMTKFPIWMISATAFYAPIRALKDISSRIIEIDTLMVNLKRVIDAPDYKFVDMLDGAVEASDQLSSKLTDVLSIMGDFGRLGFKDNELLDISKTAQILQNISDLDATSSVDTLTSAMLNYNIAAQDSITIADKLNEVDNNFAVNLAA